MRKSRSSRCQTVTFYGKVLEMSCFVLEVWKTRGRKINKKATELPLACGVPFQLALALALWYLGFTLCEWRKSIITHPCFTRNDSWLVPPTTHTDILRCTTGNVSYRGKLQLPVYHSQTVKSETTMCALLKIHTHTEADIHTAYIYIWRLHTRWYIFMCIYF